MRKISDLIIVASMLILSYSASAQWLPNDRERDGLRGRVHIVEEKDIPRDAVIFDSWFRLMRAKSWQYYLFAKKENPYLLSISLIVPISDSFPIFSPQICKYISYLLFRSPLGYLFLRTPPLALPNPVETPSTSTAVNPFSSTETEISSP